MAGFVDETESMILRYCPATRGMLITLLGEEPFVVADICRNSRNSATFSLVPFPRSSDAVASPIVIALKPMTPDMAPIDGSPQKIAGKTVTQTISSPGAVRKAEKEIAEFRRFQALSQLLIVVNQKICRLRAIEAGEAMLVKKKAETLQEEISREVETLLARIFWQRQKTGGLDLEKPSRWQFVPPCTKPG